MRYILGIDPSGTFDEGKGTTGLAVMDSKKNKIIYTGFIKAVNYDSQEKYFHAHLQWLDECKERYKNDIIISLEDYVVYATKVQNHINSHLETAQLIGLLKWYAWYTGIVLTIRLATAAKTRFNNEILEHLGYIYCEQGPKGFNWFTPGKRVPLFTHEQDAIRHAVYCYKFDNTDEKIKPGATSSIAPKSEKEKKKEYYLNWLKNFNESNAKVRTLAFINDYPNSTAFAQALRRYIRKAGYDIKITQREDTVYVEKIQR